jgi:hypothetical protein
LNKSGRRLLEGTVDWLSLAPPERWVGGVRADGIWRWDGERPVES